MICAWATLLNFAGDKDGATQKFTRQMFIVQIYMQRNLEITKIYKV